MGSPRSQRRRDARAGTKGKTSRPTDAVSVGESQKAVVQRYTASEKGVIDMSNGGPVEYGFTNKLAEMDPALQSVITNSGWEFMVGTQSWVKIDGVTVSQSAQMVTRQTPATGVSTLIQIVFSWGFPTPNKWTARGWSMWVDESFVTPKVQEWLDAAQDAQGPGNPTG